MRAMDFVVNQLVFRVILIDILLFTAFPCFRPAVAISPEGRLYRKLFNESSYEKIGRPVRNTSQPVETKLYLDLGPFTLDSVAETFHFYAAVWIIWKDEYLSWNSTEFGIEQIEVPIDRIWVPDVGMLNRLNGPPHLHHRDVQVRLSSSGEVLWLASEPFTIPCELDVSKFPFDEHLCEAWLGSMTKYEDRHKLVYFPGAARHGNFDNGGWLYSVQATVFSVPIPQKRLGWSVYTMEVHLKRKATYFVQNIIVPSMALCILIIAVFSLPCESGEKISLSISTLVAITVFQMIVADHIPTTAKHTPVLVIALTAMIGASAASILLTVFVLKLFYTSPERPMPAWFRRLVFTFLATITGMRQEIRGIHQMAEEQTASDSILPATNLRNITASPKQSSRDGTSDVTPKNTQNHEQGTWEMSARIVDRFFLFVYIFLIISIVIVCSVLIFSSTKSQIV